MSESKAPDATKAPTPDATKAPTPDATKAPTPDATKTSETADDTTKAPSPGDAAKAAADAKKTTRKAKTEAADDDDAKLPPFTVAPGRSVTSKKGILSEGDEVIAEYFEEGRNTITDLVKRKVVVEN